MKKQTPDANRSDDILDTARVHAQVLFRAAAGPTKDSRAAHALVELAVYVTSLVEDAALVNPDAVHKASRHYSFFPILLASQNGRDTKQKLARVENLPVGNARPFKRLRGQARNDNLREWIERTYDDFLRIRQGRSVYESTRKFADEVCEIPELSNHSARKWAEMMARFALEGPGGSQWATAFNIDLSKETERRRRRKAATFRKAFDVSKQLNNQPGTWTLRRTGTGKYTGFVVHDKSGQDGSVLDHAEAASFERGQSEINNITPTDADKVNTLTDVLEKRILSILKIERPPK